MFKRIAFTMYPVKDLNRAKDFYSKTLGLGAFQEMANGRWIEFDLPGGGCFAITDMIDGLEPSSEAGGSLAFEVDDVDTLAKDLKAKGVTFKMDVFETPVCRMGVAYDTEGNVFMIHKLHRES